MKRFFLLIGLSAFFLGMKAQDMATLFVSMPDQKIPQLESAWRKDLIDLFKSGKEARLKNTMNGYSILQKLTPDYLLLQSTGRSTVEMKLLPLVNNTHVICVVTTIKAPVADSRVEFFTTEWQPLDAADLFTPVSAAAFLKPGADKENPDYQYALSRLDMEMVQYDLSPDNLTLTATYTTPLYLSSEDREKVMPFLESSPVVMNWEKYHFK